MYIYIHIYYIIVKRLAYFLRNYYPPRKLFFCFGNMIFYWKYDLLPTKQNDLLRKYDSFVRKYERFGES